MRKSFWTLLDTLIESSELVIDRPKGSSYPNYPSVVYPLDYGYLKDTTAGDGDEIDVWRGSLPQGQLNAIVCTVDLRPERRNTEVKLLIGCSPTDKEAIIEVHSGEYTSAILVKREKT